MERVFFTITGTNHYYGLKFLESGMTVRLIKEPDNKIDKEAIKVELEGLGIIGYVANSPYTVVGESYSAVGFSNEKNVCVVGKCSGEIKKSDSVFEEIEAGWYTKDEIRELLKTEKFAARTQAYCYLWSRM